MKKLLFIPMLLLAVQLTAQVSQNMVKLGQWNYAYNQSDKYNDVWGYAAGGYEYAILGSVDSVHFINVTTPTNPTLVKSFKCTSSSWWRDMKTYDTYAYAVSEGDNEGLRIFSLSSLPSTVTQVLQTTAFFHKAHNIFIDTLNARLYAAGVRNSLNQYFTDLVVLSLSNPASPTLIANVNLPGDYVHDVYVRNHIAYCSHGGNGLYIYNLTNASSPVTLGSLTPPYAESGYNHSGWLTTNGNYYVFCDETHDKSVKIANVSNPSNITITDLFKSTLLAPAYTNSIVHNAFIKGDSVYLSYYHEGLQVFDISNPSNVIQRAWYDTDTLHTNYAGYRGAWGAYPYLPSGTLLASDIKNGLFVVGFSQNPPLPLELTDFQAKPTRERVLLSWTTASEHHTERFGVERSADGLSFRPIATVQAAGYSQAPVHYNTADEHPLPGTSYYRLKMQDSDGSETYSRMLTVWRQSSQVARVITNPLLTGEPVQLAFDTTFNKGEASIFTADGRLLTHRHLTSAVAGELLKLPALPAPGLYFLIVHWDGQMWSEKLIAH